MLGRPRKIIRTGPKLCERASSTQRVIMEPTLIIGRKTISIEAAVVGSIGTIRAKAMTNKVAPSQMKRWSPKFC